ncbi:hypothetical protein GCK72_021037 [Caenorhabditis remanei]|uniref:Uncharacterized protein n=1 Tax=Caenorhabditis remanei TaxID=31234 RepID=A0A6A5GI63_CAERE|nr:hypothetical protein GCK72_021037 [Caenorhabditis remanei]KAF1754474.1 hypothetical protein GCK72_021037 [Caenorhabditis remanei]
MRRFYDRRGSCQKNLKDIRHRAVSGSKYGSLDYNRPRAEIEDQRMDPRKHSTSCCFSGSTEGSLENHVSVRNPGNYASGNEAVKSENMIVGSNAVSIPLGLTSNVEDVTMVGTTSTQPT